MATWILPITSSGPGVGVAVKDLIDLAGYPTTSGSKVLAAGASPAVADAACLAGTLAACAAGQAFIVGKANLHELAFGVTGINPWYGTPVNPRDPALCPGGSSSGSATAVATGEATVAFGSDTGGSIRIPAACCAVVGLKTTYGRVPLAGVRPLAPSLDTVGPMGATVAATVKGMALLEPGFAPAAAPARLIGRLRLPCVAEINDDLDRALALTGIEVVDVDLASWQDATEAAMTILGAEAWHVHQQLWREHAHELSPDVSARLASSSAIGAATLAGSWDRAAQWEADLAACFRLVDVIALPTLADTPPPLDEASRLTQIRYVSPFNLSGNPALAMPVRSRRRIPSSLQLVGPAGSEELICATASAIEAAGGG